MGEDHEYLKSSERERERENGFIGMLDLRCHYIHNYNHVSDMDDYKLGPKSNFLFSNFK